MVTGEQVPSPRHRRPARLGRAQAYARGAWLSRARNARGMRTRTASSDEAANHGGGGPHPQGACVPRSGWGEPGAFRWSRSG